MRFSTFILLLAIIFSCTENDKICEGELKYQSSDKVYHCLQGKWRYHYSFGGFAGFKKYEDRTVTFRQDQIIFENQGNITRDTIFSIQKTIGIATNDSVNAIQWSEYPILVVQGIFEDTLRVSENFEDGFSYALTRIE